MLGLDFIRKNSELVRRRCLLERQRDPGLLDEILKIDQEYRRILREAEKIRARQNELDKEINGKPTGDQLARGRKLKLQLKKVEKKLKNQEELLRTKLEEIPNLPADDVPVGKDESENVVVKTVGVPPKFGFQPLDHVELGERLDIIDVKKSGKLSGPRFGYFKNQAAIMEMALMFYAFKRLVDKGWRGMIPPPMIKSKTEWACGYASNKNLFNAYYSLPEDDLIFISSSEHSVVPYHIDEILSEKDLPLKYVNFSPCFRRESGTYGKDTRGLFRVHFFNKVEMNVFTVPDYQVSDRMCQEMLEIEEELVRELGLSYQVKACCTGDLPQPNRRMFDLEIWFPGQNAYRETHSCSNCGDYQARRLNTRVRINGQNKFVHILNATLVTDRTLLAILENYQQEDGSIIVPEALRSLVGFEKIS